MSFVSFFDKINHSTSDSKQCYDAKSPRTATLVLLYCNLVLNMTYGVIYMLLHKTLFTDTWTNIALSLAFTETVILFFAVITVHNKKSFMFVWVIFIILFNVSWSTVSLIHFVSGHGKSAKYWDEYFAKKVNDFESLFPHILPTTNSTAFLSRYVPAVTASFVFLTLLFKLYSVWAIDRYELKSKLVASVASSLPGGKKQKTCQTVFVP